MLEPTTGQYLKMVRLQLGLSQVELASRLGVSNVSVNRWEKDRVQPDSTVLARYRQLERFGLESLSQPQSRNNVPRPVSELLGRTRELKELAGLIAVCPLVTILGTGGAGKTRIAIELGEMLSDRFEDGVWFVDLSQLVDQVSVGHAVAGVLGLTDAGRRPPTERIASYLGTRQALLILDNCEHVIAASAAIASALLATGALSRVVATSRAPLDVAGETLYPLPPVSAEVAESILVNRVRGRRPGYEPGDVERATIGTLCRRLDQLPLAIELAAARMQILSAEQIVERLDQRFEILQVSGGRPSRQRTLAAAIGWSCDLLDPAEAKLFRSLGLFSGWFDLAAVEAVNDSGEIISKLDRLASQSMILVEHGSDHAPPRYRLLDSLAAYARRWLDETGEGEPLRLLHAEHYRQLVARAAQGIHGANQARLLKSIDLAYENAIASLSWALRANESQVVLDLTNALASYWQRRGRYDEGCSWIEQVLPAIDADVTPLSISILTSYGTMLIWLGRFELSEPHLREAIDASIAIGSRAEEAKARDALGLLRRAQGNLDEASQHHQHSIAIADEIGDLRTQAMARINLGHIANTRADHEVAEAAYMDALIRIGGRGDLAAESAALANLGEVAGRMGKYQDAVGYIERAVAMARELGDPDRVSILLANEAEVLHAVGDNAGGLKRAREAVAHFRSSGNLSYLAGSLYLEGVTNGALGHRIDALLALREALQIYRDLGDWIDVAFTIEVIAQVFAESGDATRAARWLGGAEKIRKTHDADPYPIFDFAGLVRLVRSVLGDGLDPIWAAGSELPAERLVIEVLHTGRVIDGETLNPEIRSQSLDLRSMLTARQLEVLALAAEGLSNREIAEHIEISPRTVERHLTTIFTILGVERRSSAIAIGIESGVIVLRHS